MIRVLMIGDVFGDPGRRAVKERVKALRDEYQINLVIANVENAAHGRGVTSKMVQEFLASGVDVMTSGNHIWHMQEIYATLEKQDSPLMRPANLSKHAPGRGYFVAEITGGIRVAVMNIMGRQFMNPPVDCPFAAADELLAKLEDEADLFILDMHAETSSEKRAMAWHLSGKVQVVVGTHTHVQTADEEIMPEGLAYITDLGMTGPYDSVIGMKKEIILKRFRTSLPGKFEPATGDVRFCGVVIEIDEKKKKANWITRINEKLEVC